MNAFPHQVFVYGTLKRGHRNCHYLNEAKFIGRFVTEALYSMYCFDSYPAVCLQGYHAIQGEVFRVNDEQFRLLDELEQYPDYYQRVEIPTEFGVAWMYVVQSELCRGRLLLSGDWQAANKR